MAGGYRKPSKPAPVSGPGPLSQRTDGGPAQAMRDLPNAAYGEQKNFQEIQAGAPMAQANPLASIVGLGAPTQRPDEPITAGSPSGPGPGTEALGFQTDVDTRIEDFDNLSQFLPLMEAYAGTPQSSGTMRSFVRFLRSQVQ